MVNIQATLIYKYSLTPCSTIENTKHTPITWQNQFKVETIETIAMYAIYCCISYENGKIVVTFRTLYNTNLCMLSLGISIYIILKD